VLNINEILESINDSKVVITINKQGKFNLLKNGNRKLILKNSSDCYRLLWDLFNEQGRIKFFDAAFESEFKKLLKKYNKPKLVLNES